MIRKLLVLTGTISILIVVSSATTEDMTIEKIYDMAYNIVNVTNRWQKELKDDSSIEGRKSKLLSPFGLLPFHALCKFSNFYSILLFLICILKTNRKSVS